MVEWQDEAFRIPGTRVRVGLDAIVGFLLPGVGDLLSGAASMLVVVSAARRGVPARVLLAMVLNVLGDGLIGTVPLVGDALDVAIKASSRNLALLKRHIGNQHATTNTSPPGRPLLAASLVALTAAFVLVALALALGLLLSWLNA
jgi:hypothetical protein